MRDKSNGFDNGQSTFGLKRIMIALYLMLVLHSAAAQECATSGALEVTFTIFRVVHFNYNYLLQLSR